MTDKEIQKLISDTVTATVARLKMEGLLRDGSKTAYEKTEALLRQYPELREVSDPYAKRLVAEIDACLADAADDPYVDLIRLYYFAGNTNVTCAKLLPCEERTARRNRKALVERFSVRLASEEFIRELLL